MGTMQSNRTHDENSNVEAILLQIEPRIVALTRRIAYAYLSEWDCDEIVQSVRIKLLPVLADARIVNLSAYLNITVRHEVYSYLRGRKPFFPLLLDEDEEVCYSPFPGMVGDDPQVKVEQEEALLELLDRVVAAIVALPPMQRRAMICSLQERVDNPAVLHDAFLRYHIDISTTIWPDDIHAKQKLQASHSVGRRTLACKLGIDLNLYEKPRKASKRRACKRTAKESEEILSLAV